MQRQNHITVPNNTNICTQSFKSKHQFRFNDCILIYDFHNHSFDCPRSNFNVFELLTYFIVWYNLDLELLGAFPFIIILKFLSEKMKLSFGKSLMTVFTIWLKLVYFTIQHILSRIPNSGLSRTDQPINQIVLTYSLKWIQVRSITSSINFDFFFVDLRVLYKL